MDDELKNALLRVDEIQVLELLDISTEDLLERFEDKIRKRLDYLRKEMEIFSEETDILEELNFDKE